MVHLLQQLMTFKTKLFFGAVTVTGIILWHIDVQRRKKKHNLKCQTTLNQTFSVEETVKTKTSNSETDEQDLKFAAICEEKVFKYDVQSFPFLEIVCRMLKQDNLSNLHTTPDITSMKGGSKIHPYHNKFSRTLMHPNRDEEFNKCLSRFVLEVIVPLIGGGPEVCWQVKPTFRVILPSDTPVGVPHCDADYNHPASEINFWIPLTRTFGSNTLYAESSPGLGDFHPFELEYGQGCRFYGNKCRHYTVPNTTDTTRVSFDLRVIPGFYYHRYPPTKTIGTTKRLLFDIGNYYAENIEHPIQKLNLIDHKRPTQPADQSQETKTNQGALGTRGMRQRSNPSWLPVSE